MKVFAGFGKRQTFLAIAGEIGDVADFAKRLHQVVGGLTVVFDDQQSHLGVGCSQLGRLSITMARPALPCKAAGARAIGTKSGR